MAYIAPLCGEVNFNITRAYVTPDCNYLIFSFGGFFELAIRSANAKIKINASKMSIFDGAIIVPSNVRVKLNTQKSVVDLVWPIRSDNISIGTIVNNSFIRI